MTVGARTIWGLALAGALMAGGARAGQCAPVEGSWTIMAYLRADGGLQEAAGRYLAQMRGALATGDGTVAVAAQLEDETRPGWARRSVLRGPVEEGPSAVEAEMGGKAALGDFVRWAQGAAPAERYALLILAHGVPPAPESQLRQAAAGRLEIGVLAEALAEVRTPHFEVVFLDCCYSGSVEVAERLIGRARYLVAAPGLLYSPGLPWGEITGDLVAGPQRGGRDLALTACRRARAYWSEQGEWPASLAVVDLDRLVGLTESLRDLARAALPRVAELTPELTLARGRAAGWGPERELVEVASLTEALAETTRVAEVAEAAKTVSVAAHSAIVEAWRQSPGDEAQTGAGLGIFCPLSLRAWSPGYGVGTEESFTAEWALLLRAYLQNMAQLAQATR